MHRLTRKGLDPRRAPRYEVEWSLMPAQLRCPDNTPPFDLQPLPRAALVSRFRGGDVFTGESHIACIPVDIDHRWSDMSGSHRVTWKGSVCVAEPLV